MFIPADIPENKKKVYAQNMNTLTNNTDHIFLLAGDHKIEHLNADFYGSGIDPEAANPEHLFKIAASGNVGAFATHFGLIARYGSQYPNVPYIVKLNGKTNIIDSEKDFSPETKPDPISSRLWQVADVATLQDEAKLRIIGIGYTVYLGSSFEHVMLEQAAQAIIQAHQLGLLAILWIYPRGKAITHDADLALLAGAAGVANALGADIVKIKAPHNGPLLSDVEQLRIIKQAAGNTKVICAGGEKKEIHAFLHEIRNFMQEGTIDGMAIGRNIFQRNLHDAIAHAQKISQEIYGTLS